MLKNKNDKGYKIIFEIANEVKSAFEKILEQRQLLSGKSDFPIICTGGQAKNPLWMQFKSDITNLELFVTNCPDAELMGNAIIANTQLKNYKTLKEAADTMVICEKKYLPQNQFLWYNRSMKIENLNKTLSLENDGELSFFFGNFSEKKSQKIP